MHRRLAKFAALIVMTSGIGLVPGQSATAQATAAGRDAVGHQVRFVQFLLGAQANQLRVQEGRLAQERATVARIDAITQRVPSSLRQARDVINFFNRARTQFNRFQAQSRLGNFRLLSRQAQISSLIARLLSLAPTDARVVRLNQQLAVQAPRVNQVVTATPARPMVPVPFPGA